MQLTFKKSLVVLFLILLLGGFLRLYKVGDQSFIADEYLGINISYGYFKSGQWKNWNFNEEKLTDESYTRAKVYYWQVAQTFKFLEPTEANARLASVAWGMIGIISIFIISFLVTRNYYIAIISALLMSVSISSLIYDRKLRMYSMFVPVFLWFSYAVYYFLESNAKKGFGFVKKLSEKTGLNWNFFTPVIVLGAISFLTHTLAVNIVASVIAYLLVMLGITYKKDKKINNKYLTLFLAAVLLVVLALNVGRIRGAAAFFSFWINNWSYLQKVTLDYSNILLAGVFFVIGAYQLAKKHSKIGIWTVVTYLAILFAAIMIWKRSAGHQYILLTQSFKIIIMASGVYYSAKIISDKIFNGSKKWFLGILVLILMLLFNFSFFASADNFYGQNSKWSYSNYREVFQYYLNHRSKNSALITRPAVNYYLSGTETSLIGYNRDEEELTLEKVKDAQKDYNDVWVIYSNTTYIDGDARHYIWDNFENIETKYTNGRLEIWRWQEDTNSN